MSPGELARLSSSGVGNVGNSNILSSPAVGPPSYPPTEVQRWLTCPVFWQRSKVWEPRLASWTPHRLVGTAIHFGIAAWLAQIKGPPSSLATNTTVADPVESALGVLGEGYIQQDTWDLAGLSKLVERGVRVLTALAETELLPGAEIVAIEYADDTDLPAGVTVPRTCDLILKRGDWLEVIDWKTSINLDEKYLDEKKQEVCHSWQLLDYSWHAERRWFRVPVRRALHGLVALGPGKPKVWLLPVRVSEGLDGKYDPARLDQWRRDAERIWYRMWDHSQMTEASPKPWHNWKACTDRHLHYGKACELWDSCHVYYDEERLFEATLRRKD